MKKILSVLFAFIISTACFSFVGCEEEKKDEITLINGCESYDDLLNFTFYDPYEWQTDMHSGTVSVSNDEKFITEGSGCAKFHYDYHERDDAIYTSPEYAKISGFSFMTANYGEIIKYINKIEYISFDVYNDSEYTFDLFLGIYGNEHKKNICSDGTKIYPKGLTKVKFNLKPWLYEENTSVSYYDFYLVGADVVAERTFDMYYDNFEIKTITENKRPENEDNHNISYGGIELLRFDSMSDLDYVKVFNTMEYYELPLAGITYSPVFKGLGESGALRMDMYTPYKDSKLLWTDKCAYDIIIDKELLTKINNAKSVSVRVFNDNNYDVNVSLIACCGDKEKEAKQTISAGESGKIVFDDELKDADKFLIRANVWNVPRECILYFADLMYTM